MGAVADMEDLAAEAADIVLKLWLSVDRHPHNSRISLLKISTVALELVFLGCWGCGAGASTGV